MDRRALSTPKSAERSVETLARYLAGPAQNEEEKARALFRWITENITYDTRAYFTGQDRSAGPDDVLKTRKGVCEGFSGLFEKLGRAAGLEIVTVSGHAKGYGTAAGGRFEGPPDHAWNAVRIRGKWRLVDATWGAGYVNESGRFVRMFNAYFFFTPPERLIYTHFPEDSRWQLIDLPVPLKTFEGYVYLRPAFFLNGLELQSHTQGEILTGDSLCVLLHVPRHAAILAQLVRNGRDLDPGLTFAQTARDTGWVHAVFPSAGTYFLRVFAKPKKDPGSYFWALDYKVVAGGSSAAKPRFPETYKAFMDKDVFLERPLAGLLQAGRSYRFRLRIPGATKAAVVRGEKWTDLQRDGEWFEGLVAAVKGKMNVFAKFPGNDTYDGLLKYTGY
jgi:transglutaminase/protease-like cytokinesis protein 3